MYAQQAFHGEHVAVKETAKDGTETKGGVHLPLARMESKAFGLGLVGMEGAATAKELAQELVECSRIIGGGTASYLMPQRLKKYISVSWEKKAEAEQRAYAILEQCTEKQLNYVVTNVPLSLVLDRITDRGPNKLRCRSRIVALLARDKLPELSVLARAKLLRAMQAVRLGAVEEGEQLALAVLKGSKGQKLSRLKGLLDSGGDINSLHKLVWIDVMNEGVSQAIHVIQYKKLTVYGMTCE